MPDWPLVGLGEVTLKIGSGATPRGGKDVYQPTGVSFIRSQNVFDNRFSFVGLARITDAAANDLAGVAVQLGDVLIDITGESVTRTCEVDPAVLPARVSQHVAIVRPNPTMLDAGFLVAALLEPQAKNRLNQLSSAGATRRALTKGHLSSFSIRLPPLEEQRRIAGVLGALDDLVDTNRSISAQTADLAVALTQVSPRRVLLSSVARAVNPQQFRAEGQVDHYSIPIFDELRLPERVDGSTVRSNKLRIAAPSVLVSRLNPQTPRVWMAYPGDVPAAASTEFLALGAKAGATVEEVWALCASEELAAQMRSRVTGTTGSHQRVDKAAIPSLLVPDLAAVDPVARAAIASLVREAHASLLAARDATATRDELLPLLLSRLVQVNPSKSVGV